MDILISICKAMKLWEKIRFLHFNAFKDETSQLRDIPAGIETRFLGIRSPTSYDLLYRDPTRLPICDFQF